MDYGQKGVIGLQHACIFFDDVGRPVALNGGKREEWLFHRLKFI